MGFQRYASFSVLASAVADASGGLPADVMLEAQTLSKQAHRHEFTYSPRPGYLYVRSRAISSRCNDNFDEFPAEEIKKAYATFIGKPVFVNHHNDNHRRARGVIIDAALHEDLNPDGTPDTWAEVLMEVDAIRFPRLAEGVIKGHIDRTSMGTDVAYSVCTYCGNTASNPSEYCVHIPRMKGQRITRRTASGVQEAVLVAERCYGLGFFENSLLVEQPADPTAYAWIEQPDSQVLAKSASLSQVTSETQTQASRDDADAKARAKGHRLNWGNRPGYGYGGVCLGCGAHCTASGYGTATTTSCPTPAPAAAPAAAPSAPAATTTAALVREATMCASCNPNAGLHEAMLCSAHAHMRKQEHQFPGFAWDRGFQQGPSIDGTLFPTYSTLGWESLSKAAAYDPPTVSGMALRAADTGRLLMIQRSNKDQDDPARGTWEFPGGHHEDSDAHSLDAAIREWTEEVGQPFPDGAAIAHTWRTGPYQGYLAVVPSEEALNFGDGRATVNPDDPGGDDHEQAAWWDPEHAKNNPALRQELKDTWSQLAPGLKTTAALAAVNYTLTLACGCQVRYIGSQPQQIRVGQDWHCSTHGPTTVTEVGGSGATNRGLGWDKQSAKNSRPTLHWLHPDANTAVQRLREHHGLFAVSFVADENGFNAAALHEIASDGGFSVNPQFQNAPENGYAVSLSKTSEKAVSLSAITASDITNYRNRYASDLAKPNNYLGAWVHNGEVFLDVSEVVPDKNEAIQLAHQRDQLGIFDLANGETIDTSHPMAVAAAKTFPSSDFGKAKSDQTCSRWNCNKPAASNRESGGKSLGACAEHQAEMTKSAYGEQVAPAKVDTLRDEACPVCGDRDSYSGDNCLVCGYVKPPEKFGDPDLSKAKQVDLRDGDVGAVGQELRCPDCGETFSSAGPAKATTTTGPATPEMKTMGAWERLAAGLPPWLDKKKKRDPKDEDNDDQKDTDKPAEPNPFAKKDDNAKPDEAPLLGEEQDPKADPKDPAAPADAVPAAPEQPAVQAGDMCPNCGEGVLEPVQPADNDADQDIDPNAKDPAEVPAAQDAAQPDPTNHDVAPQTPEAEQDKPAEKDEDDDEEPDDEDDDKDPLKPKKKPSTAAANRSRQQVEGKTVDMPMPREERQTLLTALRQQQSTIQTQAAQIEALRAGLFTIAKAAGVEKHPHLAILKSAADTNDAPVAMTTDDSRAPQARDDVESVGAVPAPANVGVTPAAVTDVQTPNVAISTEPFNDLVDATVPTPGTDAPDPAAAGAYLPKPGSNVEPNQTPFPTNSGWTASKEDPQERLMASLVLARLRRSAGLQDGDDLANGQGIHDDASLSLAAIKVETATLEKVVTASRTATRQAPVSRSLVPQRAEGVQRTVPSVTASAGAGRQDDTGVSPDSFLF